MVTILGLFNYISLRISGDLDQKQYLLLSISPLLIGFPFFGINLLISTFLHKTKKSIGISLGLVFIFYLINTLSELSTKVEFLKYMSIYTLADVRNVITDVKINPWMIIISIVITLLCILGAITNYQKKELL